MWLRTVSSYSDDISDRSMYVQWKQSVDQSNDKHQLVNNMKETDRRQVYIMSRHTHDK
jgi:hypothetical protein